MKRSGIWIPLAVGLASAFGLYYIRGFIYWQAAVVGAAIALLTWSVMRTTKRLADLYRPRE